MYSLDVRRGSSTSVGMTGSFNQMCSFGKAIDGAVATLESLRSVEPQITRAAAMLAKCFERGGKILACGNGGSAADAADFTAEFVCRFAADRRPFPALNLSQGGSVVSAIGNDYGFEEVFARQVRAFGEPGDVLVAMSTSGRSANICRALDTARARQLESITLLGRDGGECKGVGDVELIVASDSTARIQEAHKFILHVLCEFVEPQLGQIGGR